MKKKICLFIVICATFCTAVFLLPACKKTVNYLDYVSEKRTNVYLYSDDDVDIKLNCLQREQPYSADGIKGDMNSLVEIYVSLPKNPEELEVSFENLGGEMNYLAVENCFYLCFTAEGLASEGVDITLTHDNESKTYRALSVRYGGVISCDDAVNYVVEHDKQLFDSLTDNGLFNGEIYVRLLYDEGCYYYVGVCDKSKKITAYLIDGERGKVIATKQMQG